MNKQVITNTLKSLQKTMRKHSPAILTGIGIAGMVATTVMAVRATPKALRMVDDKEIEDGKRLTTSEIIKTTWKCYIPAAVTGVCSAACIIGASSISARRNAALVTAYTISETALKEYKDSANGVLVGKPAGSGYPSDLAIPTQDGMEWALYPSAVNGSQTTYVPDGWNYYGGSPCLRHGGSYSQYLYCGPFYVSYGSASNQYSSIGCRLQERPPKAA